MSHSVSNAITSADLLHDKEAGCDRASFGSRVMPDALLSFALVVGVPVAFWLTVLEFVAPTLGFSYGMAGRVIIGGGLAMVMTLLWSAIWNSGRLDNDVTLRSRR